MELCGEIDYSLPMYRIELVLCINFAYYNFVEFAYSKSPCGPRGGGRFLRNNKIASFEYSFAFFQVFPFLIFLAQLSW